MIKLVVELCCAYDENDFNSSAEYTAFKVVGVVGGGIIYGKKGQKMIIYFNERLVNQTIEIVKEAHDCVDVLCDLIRIKQEKENINLYGAWIAAEKLNLELRQKYSCINSILSYANQIAAPKQPEISNYSKKEILLSYLEQDRFGILCDTAIKKQIIHNFKDFIRKVD